MPSETWTGGWGQLLATEGPAMASELSAELTGAEDDVMGGKFAA